MKRVRIAAETIVLVALALIVLWKGGKSLDAVWAMALLAGGVTVWNRFSSSRFVPPGFLALLVLLVVWSVISFAQSATLNYGFDEILQAVSLGLLALWAAAESMRNNRFSERFAQTLALATLIACAFGVAMYVFQPVGRFVGTFFDYRFHTDYWPNAWAEFLLLAWPLLVWVLWTRKNKELPPILRHDAVKAAVLGFVSACLLLSYSRGGFIAFAGELALLAVLIAVFHPKTVQFQRVPLAALVTVLVAGAVFVGVNQARSAFHDVQSVVEKATFSSAEGASSVSERKEFWQQAALLAMEKPVFGWGPYSFRFIQPHWQSSVLATSDHAHNVFLKYAADRGIPAALLLAMLFGWALWSGIRPAKRSKEKIVPLRLMFVAGVAGVLAHNLIDYNLQFVAIALPLWMMVGMLVARPEPKKGKGDFRKAEAIVAVLLLLFTFFEGMNLALSSKARHAAARGEVFTSLSWYALTGTSMFPRDAWLSRAAILLGLNQLPQAEGALSRYLEDNAEDGRAWRLLGDIYLQWNKPQDALRAYEKAYDFAKYNDIGITRQLIILLAEQDHEELLERRSEFDALLNDFGLAIAENTHFIVLGKNVEELAGLCDEMARLFPGEADEYLQLKERVLEHAVFERAKTASRPRGLLW